MPMHARMHAHAYAQKCHNVSLKLQKMKSDFSFLNMLFSAWHGYPNADQQMLIENYV